MKSKKDNKQHLIASENFFKQNRFDLLLLILLAVLFMIVVFPLTRVDRHMEMYLVMQYLPESLSDLWQSLFDRWPPGPGQGWNYRPLQLSIIPYALFHFFQWNHHNWLSFNLIFPCFTIVLTYVLMKVLTKSRMAAFFSSLFLFSYYINIYRYTIIIQYDPESLFIPLCLMCVILFLLDLKKHKIKYTMSLYLFFVLALMSKELAATIPLLLLICVFLFKPEMLADTHNRIKRLSFAMVIQPGTFIALVKDIAAISVRYFPLVMIWSFYLLFRVAIPMVNGIFDTAPSRAHTLTLDPIRIYTNFKDFASGVSQVELYSGYIGVHFFTLLCYIMLTLFAFMMIIFVVQILRGNRVMFLGLFFFMIQSAVYILMNAPHSLHHLMSPLIGPAIVFGESVRICYGRLERFTWPGKKILFGAVLATVVAAFAINSWVFTREFIHKKYNYWESRAMNAIDNALPKPEDRNSDTIFYIKGFDYFPGKRDFYYEVIKAAYYRKKNITLIHESVILNYKQRLSKMKAADYTIVVLEHIDLYNTKNITDEPHVAEILQYMDNRDPYRFASAKLQSNSRGIRPILWRFFQTGTGGEVKKISNVKGEVFHGKSSVKIEPPVIGKSVLSYLKDDSDEINNGPIRFAVWVRSSNTTPDAIQVSVQNGSAPAIVKSYKNSGEWERLTIETDAGRERAKILISLSVTSSAIAPAVFDLATFDILSDTDVQTKISNDSFEYWVESASRGLVPEDFSFHGVPEQGGAIERCTTPDGVKDGHTSVLLRRPVSGTIFFRQQLLEIDDIRDHRVRFSAWIKSANRAPNAVQIDLQDGVNPVAVSSYKNTGGWEFIEIEKQVSSEAKKVLVTLAIKSNATAPAYFDDLNIDVLPAISYKGVPNSSFEMWGHWQDSLRP